MSAVMAQSVEYVLIPGQGGFPSVISASDAHKRITSDHQDCAERASRFSDLLEQRGAGHVPFWFTGADVIIRGDIQTAWTISNVVHELPNMMPTARADNDNGNVVSFPERQHIGAAFAEAVNPLLKAPDVSAEFRDASAYEAMTQRRQPSYGYRRGGMERHAA